MSPEAVMNLLDTATETPSVDEFSDCDTEANFSSDSAEFDNESDSSDEDDQVEDARVWCRVDPGDCRVPPPHFPFKGNNGLKVDIEHDPLQCLCLFFDDKVMEIIVIETN